jgi:hypothetical protein
MRALAVNLDSGKWELFLVKIKYERSPQMCDVHAVFVGAKEGVGGSCWLLDSL